jgi:hypothetical protein
MLPRAVSVIGAGRRFTAFRPAAACLAGRTIREIASPLYDKPCPGTEEAFDDSAALRTFAYRVITHALKFFKSFAAR